MTQLNTHTHTHIYTHIYIYVCVCARVCVSLTFKKILHLYAGFITKSLLKAQSSDESQANIFIYIYVYIYISLCNDIWKYPVPWALRFCRVLLDVKDRRERQILHSNLDRKFEKRVCFLSICRYVHRC